MQWYNNWLWLSEISTEGMLTFLANQVPLAWVTHSLEWIPVSIQMPGRFDPPVLNYRWEWRFHKLPVRCDWMQRWVHYADKLWLILPTADTHLRTPPSQMMMYLQYVQRTVLIAVSDLQLAHQCGIFSHQHVHESIDLNTWEKYIKGGLISPAIGPNSRFTQGFGSLTSLRVWYVA